MFVRFYTLMANRAHFKNLIESREYFWKFDDFNDPIKQQMTTVLDSLLKYQKIFLYSCYITITLVCSFPLLQKNHTLPFASWIPDGYPYLYESVYILQCILVVIDIHIVIGFDCIFATICIQVILQYRLLNITLRNMGLNSKEMSTTAKKKENIKEMKRCIQHHVFLLRLN